MRTFFSREFEEMKLQYNYLKEKTENNILKIKKSRGGKKDKEKLKNLCEITFE